VNFEAYKQQLEGDGALVRRDAAAAAGPHRGAEPAGRHLADRPRAGLEEKLFQPMPAEVRKDFYAELPIKIR
jgi:hypothetical protein